MMLVLKLGLGKKIVLGGVGLLALGMPARAQMVHAEGPLPTFEVATIRPWQPQPAPIAPDGSAVMPTVKVVPKAGAITMSDRVHEIGQAGILIASAYGLNIGTERRMIVGGPEWVQSQSDRYEVNAKIGEADLAAMKTMSMEQRREQLALMKQALLADRFKLKVHFERREMPSYAVVVAKGGAKLTPAKPGEVYALSTAARGDGMKMTGTAATVKELVNSSMLGLGGAPVEDRTGIAGEFDFTLEWSRADATAEGSDAPGIFVAVQEQLGLKLVPAKAMVEVLVIDHIERPVVE